STSLPYSIFITMIFSTHYSFISLSPHRPLISSLFPYTTLFRAYLEEKIDNWQDISLMEWATILEDAIDIHDRHWKIHWMLNFAQLSATLNLEATVREVRGEVDQDLLGRLQNSAKDRNWDSIEALWRMKEEIVAD